MINGFICVMRSIRDVAKRPGSVMEKEGTLLAFTGAEKPAAAISMIGAGIRRPDQGLVEMNLRDGWAIKKVNPFVESSPDPHWLSIVLKREMYEQEKNGKKNSSAISQETRRADSPKRFDSTI